MFNLEQAIQEWRRQLAASGIKSRGVLDELESHLREEAQEQMRGGLSAQDAFAAAVQRMGKAGALQSEFKKLGGFISVKEKLMIAAGMVLLVSMTLLGAFTAYFCFATWSERLLAFAPMLCTLLVAYGWKYAVPFLPVLSSRGKRWGLGLGCIAAGLGASSFYCNVILPHFEDTVDRQIPAIGFWAAFLIAIFTCTGLGLMMSEHDRMHWGMKKSRIDT